MASGKVLEVKLNGSETWMVSVCVATLVVPGAESVTFTVKV